MQTGDVKCENSANDGIRNSSERENRVFEVVEQAVKSTGNQDEADWNDDFQPFLRLLEIAELARPDQMVSRGKLDVFRDARLSLFNRASQIAATDAELDGDEPLHALVINPRRSSVQSNCGQFTERNISIGAGGRCVGNLDIADFVSTIRNSLMD